MNKPLTVDPPEGYTLFATRAANGWSFWVPPISLGYKPCLREYQYSVSTFDVQNDFSPHGHDPTRPYIPQFVALWCAYVISFLDHRTISTREEFPVFLGPWLATITPGRGPADSKQGQRIQIRLPPVATGRPVRVIAGRSVESLRSERQRNAPTNSMLGHDEGTRK
jgi:hypothetical protein